MGFEKMDPAVRAVICSKGGKAAHNQVEVKCHEFTSEEAKVVGRKGGQAILNKRGPEYFAELGRKGGRTVSQNREYMAEIGRRGGKKLAAIPGYMEQLGSAGGKATQKAAKNAA